MADTQIVDFKKLGDAQASVKDVLETLQENIDAIGANEGVQDGENIAAELAAAKQSFERGLVRLSNVTSPAVGQASSSGSDQKSSDEE